MEDPKAAIADRLKQANNILVTVSANPSVDQLAACIGMTLALNKLGKHATAVFSGEAPSTIEFLQPEKTLEKNTDSLRDFIIALDKAKADKLRYKVEDKVVKIFITPYRTSIGPQDLNFSQGDFNVDVVLALGVHQQQDLDQAIIAHGRILHDATVATVNVKPGGQLGTLNWLEPQASSLSELAVELLDVVDKKLMDAQMATAFLTGIVAETNRFSNDKTYPITMSISAELMAAGADQKLVATKLEEAAPPPPAPAPPPPAQAVPAAPPPAPPKSEDGTLEISHNDVGDLTDLPEDTDEPEQKMQQVSIDDRGYLHNVEENMPPAAPPAPTPPSPAAVPPAGNIDPTSHLASQHIILQPPTLASGRSDLSSITSTEGAEPSSGDPPARGPEDGSVLDAPFGGPAPSTIQPTPLGNPMTIQPSAAAPPPVIPLAPPPMPTPPPTQTLSAIEQEVHSPHLTMSGAPVPSAQDIATAPLPGPADAPPQIDNGAALETARAAVNHAVSAAFNALPLGDPLHEPPATPVMPSSAPGAGPMILPPVVLPPDDPTVPPAPPPIVPAPSV